MTLGRGLESLIPPRREGGGNIQKSHTESKEITSAENKRDEGVVVEPVRTETAQVTDTVFAAAPSPVPTPAPAPALVPTPTPSQSSVYLDAGPEEKIEGAIFQIEVDKISPNPNQPRRYFDENALRELATSIREFGILQPLIISKIESESEKGWSVRYELVAGERRLMAAKLAGLHTVPAVVRREPSDREKLELAVIENIQREDLNPIEFARAVARLQDEFGFTQREIATRIGKSREAIANAVRLLALPSEIQAKVAEGQISESHARLLLSVDDPSLQKEVFDDILKYKLNVRETDARIRRGKGGERGEGAQTEINPEIESLKGKLEEFLGTKINLQSKGASGKITINFYSPEELEAIVDKVIKDRQTPPRQNDNQSPLSPSEF